MADRPKRVIMKPSRYKTTSSDECLKRRKIEGAQPTEDIEEEMEEDITEMRTMMEQPANAPNYNTITNTQAHAFSQVTPTHMVQTPTPNQTSASQTQYSHTMPQNISDTSVTQYNAPQHTYDMHTEMQDKTYYTNSYHSSFQMSLPTQQLGQLHQIPRSEVSQTTEWNNLSRLFHERVDHLEREINPRSLHERMDRLEAEVKKISGLLQTIAKSLETNRDRKRLPRKPSSLPMSTYAQMDAFQAISDDEFEEVIGYFNYIGGFNLKEAVNFCLKEALTDDITPLYTWCGSKTQGDKRPLYNTRIVIAIYEAVCANKHFTKPSRSEFQVQMREALRAAKQRFRNKAKGQATAGPNRAVREFWNDEEDDVTDNDE